MATILIVLIYGNCTEVEMVLGTDYKGKNVLWACVKRLALRRKARSNIGDALAMISVRR